MPGTHDRTQPDGPSARTGRLPAAIAMLLACLALAGPVDAHLSIIRQGVESRGTAEAGDEYGKSLAAGDFNGDGYEDLAVGSPNEAIGSLGAAGAVIISWGSALGITHVGASILTQDDWVGATAGVEFGYALAAGDFNHDGRDDLAVGCPGFALSIALPDVGVVYLYRGGPGGLSAWNSINQGDAGGAHEAGDRFGSALCAGNFNGDSTPFEDLAIGCPGEDGNAGAIFWFCGGSPNGLLTGPNGWLKQSSLGSTSVAGDQFGFSLAAGQVTGTSHEDLLVGAPYKDTAGVTDSGIAYLISGSAAGLTTSNALIDATTGDFGSTYQTTGYFGYAVAIGRFYSGSYKGVAISEPGRTISGLARAGRLCVAKGGLAGIDAAGPEAIVLTEANAGQIVAGGEYFGRALAAGRFDTDDGYDDLVVGAPNDNAGAANAGLLLLFYGGSGGPGGYGWGGFYQGTCNDPSEPGDLFGWAVAVGRFDGTGKGNIAAGAPGEDFSSGMAHVIAPWRQCYNIGARTAIALDCEGNIVFSAKPFDDVCIASTTKSMTLLLACERTQLPASDPRHLDLNAQYAVKEWIRQNVGGSLYNFLNLETMSLEDLLYAMMFPSGNDAAYAIADLVTGGDNNWNGGYAGTCQTFVNEMNIRAIQLGMGDTFFTNPAGLDVGSHHSTAADMMKLARAIVDNPLASEVVRTTSHQIVDQYYSNGWKSNTRTIGFGFLQNLKARNPNFVGIKPGKTPCAGRTGIFAATEPSEGIGLAGTFGTSASGSSAPYYDAAASLMQLGLAQCDYDFAFLPDFPLFRFDVSDLSTQFGRVTGGSIGIDRETLEIPCIKVDLIRSAPGAPSSAGLDIIRTSETLFAGAEQIDLGIAPFESHGEVVFINQGESTARFRVYPSYMGEFVSFQLAPGERGVLPAHSEASERFVMGIQNTSGDATSIPMLLSVKEEYGFELANIPGTAGLVFSAEIERAGSVQEDGVQFRCRGTDPNGGPILYGSAHELALTVDAPEPGVGATAETRIAMKPAAPNPFRTATRLAFELRVPGSVALTIHDLQGRRIRRFDQTAVNRGAWAVLWDGKSDAGAPCAAGVYFYRLEVDGKQEAEGRVLRIE